MPKVSVIVPVYGVEKYIERCARCLFEQTLEDMEFIFVDDCTKDNSIHVLENVIADYPVRRNQIKILHHNHNKGLSHARETGINAATGDFIGHCDSDDWVDKEMYEIMYNCAVNGSYDYVKCGHKKSDGENILEVSHAYYEIDMTSDKIKENILQFNGWNSLWDTLVSRDVYIAAKPQYTDFAMLEDFFLTSQLLLHAHNVTYVNETFYYYFVNPDSICGLKSVDAVINKVNQAKKNVDVIIGLLKSDGSIIISQTEIVHAKWIVKNMLIPVMDNPEANKLWSSIYPEIRTRVLFDRSISWHNKVRFYVADLNLYKYFRKP